LPGAEPHSFLASYDAIKRNYLPEDDLREIIAVTFLDVVEIQAKIPAASCSLNSRATAAKMPRPAPAPKGWARSEDSCDRTAIVTRDKNKRRAHLYQGLTYLEVLAC